MDAEKSIFFRNSTYRIDGSLLMSRFQRLTGFGPSNSDGYRLLPGDTNSPKLIFDGSGVGCIQNADPLLPMNHGGISGMVLRATGDYEAVIDFKSCTDVSFDKLRIETSGLATAGIRSIKISPTDASWCNTITNCNIRLPDSSTKRSLNIDWSDSTIMSSHFCGGVGVLESGYGVKFIGGSIERSSYAGLTIKKITSVKNTRCIGVQFDANASHGVLVDTTGDITGNRWLDISINGCDFRTVSPVSGASGSSNIQILTSYLYGGGVIGLNTHMVPGVAPYGFTSPQWTPAIAAESKH